MCTLLSYCNKLEIKKHSPTVDPDGAVRLSQRVLGHTSVIPEAVLRDALDPKRHVGGVGTVHRHCLEVVVCSDITWGSLLDNNI